MRAMAPTRADGAIYLDHNATSPLLPQVADAVSQALRRWRANPASAHRSGRAAQRALERARTRLAEALGCDAAQLVFTSGGSEANRLALELALAWGRARGRHVVVASRGEHPSLLERLFSLERSGALTLRWIDLDANGHIALAQAAAQLDERVALVTCIHANYETGVIAPVAELAACARAVGALVHTDAVQSFGRIGVEPGRLGVDLCSFTAHKCGGPPGVGALWVRGGYARWPRQGAQRQEGGLRPGTPNLPGAIGFALAATQAQEAVRAGVPKRIERLRDRLEAALLETIPGAARNGAAAPRLPNTTSLRFAGTDGHELVRVLSELGVEASSGSACASDSLRPSPVLSAMGLDAAAARGALRLSLGLETREEEIERAIARIRTAVARVRRLMGTPTR